MLTYVYRTANVYNKKELLLISYPKFKKELSDLLSHCSWTFIYIYSISS